MANKSVTNSEDESLDFRFPVNDWNYVKNPKSNQRLTGHYLHFNYLMRNEEIQNILQLMKYDKRSTDSSFLHEDLDDRINTLNEEIFKLKNEILNFKPIKSKGVEVQTILIKKDCLEIMKRDLLSQIEKLEVHYNFMKSANSTIFDSISKVHLKNEYQNQIDEAKKQLKHTETDYFNAQILLLELKKVGWSYLPISEADSLNRSEVKMKNLKSKLEEIRFVVYTNKTKLLKMKKEIFALQVGLDCLSGISLLFEDGIKKKIETKKNLDGFLKELCVTIQTNHDKLDSYHKIVDLNNAKIKSALINTNDLSKFPNSEVDIKQMEFLQEKIVQLDKEIISGKKDLEIQTNTYLLLDVNRVKIAKLKEEIEREMQARDLMTANLRQEVILRKTYYNQIEDLKGKIRVFCRCRPISQEEINRGNKQCVSFPDMFTIVVVGASREKTDKEYYFDKVFSPMTTQEIIFQDTSKLLQSAFDGFNVCIFAYGQTGSGKTFTLIGNMENNPGIVPRAFEKIFQIANEGKTKYKALIQCYMLELYNDKLLDLMTVGAVYSDKLEIKKDVHGMVIVPGAEFITAADTAHLKELFLKGSSNRHIASTKMNSESSRSHLIISLAVTCHIRNSDNIIRGKISIIDLAGSERVAKSGVQGVGAQEAMSINISLSALGDVISALTTGQAFIPYRNNKLTMLMQDSIGGNAKTVMFVNISPVDYNILETLNSLAYGTRVKLIKNKLSKSSFPDEMAKLQKITDSLQKGET